MKIQMYKAVIFDLDGTLIDNSASFRLAYQRICINYPALSPEDPEQRDELIGILRAKDREDAYINFCKHWNLKQMPGFRVFWEEWFALYAHSALPFPGVTDTLRYLQRKNIRLGLITNGESAIQTAKIRSSGLYGYFQSVLVSGDLDIAKPFPEIFRISANELGVKEHECLFVGDTPKTDIAGAIAAGMDSLLVNSTAESSGETYRAPSVTVLETML